MNISYLSEYISRRLHTYVRAYDQQKQILSYYCARPTFYDPLISNINVIGSLLSIPNQGLPLILSINQTIAYAAIAANENIYVIGPVRFERSVSFNHELSGITFPSEWLHEVPLLELTDLIDSILLLYNLFHDSIVKADTVITENCLSPFTHITIQKEFSSRLFQTHEYGKQHNPYDQEVREFSSIRNGDLLQLEKSWAEDYVGTLGILAKDPIRNLKNLGIVLITLASRAAIEGGVLPEVSFSLSDSYINQIEAAKTGEAATSLARQAEYQYAKMVHDLKKQKQSKDTATSQSRKIEQCKELIFSHLHEKISLSDIALYMNLNPNYLSGLFKKEEGMTIGSFIMQEKINLVKNLLTYSDYSFIEIATYLNFSSQSHLGSHFKRQTGYTLLEYRDKYGIKHNTTRSLF
ncbi:MAG: hypothetical protein PWP24_730 [Clostridiales bacterium]|nr:hypothetical protein [Clostridiales bacterium]